MRSIPAELKAKIESARQTLGENADPRLKIFVNNSRWVELFKVYTIHEWTGLGAIDVTAKRGAAGVEPDRVYAVYVNNGTVHVKSKPLPYNEMIPWEYEYQVSSSAQDVAIEFNGAWVRDDVSKRFNFVSDGDPWIFLQSAGTLTTQQGQGSQLTLATGVSRICALRGWFPAQEGAEADQGLIVAYIKSGSVYYRAYCEQPNGVSYIWEDEQVIVTLPTDCVDVALFRTNDFRVGFIAQRSNGEVHWTLTARNWTGMSIFPEHINSNVTAIAEFTLLTFGTGQTKEHISAEIAGVYDYCPANYAEGGLIDSHGKITDTQIEILFKYPLLAHIGFQNYFALTGTGAPGITETAQGDTPGKLILTLNGPLDGSITYNLLYTPPEGYCAGLRVDVSPTCTPSVDYFNLELVGTPPVGYTDEHITAGMVAVADFWGVNLLNANGSEHVVAGISATATLWDLTNAPV